MNIDEIIEQYTLESSIDTNIDRLNVTDVQEKLVNNKHKWSARLINHKIKLNKYKIIVKWKCHYQKILKLTLKKKLDL